MTSNAVGTKAGVIHRRTRERREVALRVTGIARRAANRNVIGRFGDHRRCTDKCQACGMTGRASSRTNHRMVHRGAREAGEHRA